MTDPARFPYPVEPGGCPSPEYRRLLAAGTPHPVELSSGRSALLVGRHADVAAVLNDDRFSRAGYAALARPLLARSTDSLPLITADAPEHTRRRRSVLAAFTARRVRRLRPRLEALADQLLTELAAGADHGEAELVNAFTVPFPLRVICEVLGVPYADSAGLRREVDVLMSTSGHSAAQVAEAQARMDGYFARLVAAKQQDLDRGQPADDLLTELLQRPADDPEPRLSPREVLALGSGLLMAGYETTGNSFAMCVLLLLQRPELVARLRADPGLVPGAVEEMLRWTSLNNTGGVPHLVTESTVLGGATVRAGQVVVPITDAANRDPAVFKDPETFDPDRTDHAEHLAFGHGRHYCLGAELARAELQIGISALLRHFPVLELAAAAEDLTWRQTMYINGVWQLPVRWVARTGEQP